MVENRLRMTSAVRCKRRCTSSNAFTVQRTLLKVDGVVDVACDPLKNSVEVWGFAELKDLTGALDNAGFTARDWNAKPKASRKRRQQPNVDEIGRAQVRTPGTNAHLVCHILL